MREILFRGKTIFGDWVYGQLSISNGATTQPEKGPYISNSVGSPWAFHVRPETVGQYSEWKDINNVKIFEGDIVQVEYGIGKVIFHAGCFMIEWLEDKEANMELLTMQNFKTGHVREDLVVTGNIFDNPQA